MYILIYFTLFIFNFGTNNAENVSEVLLPDGQSVNDLADALLTLLGAHNVANKTQRIKELREKLQKIDSYVVDKKTYSQLLLNETKHSDLNETNFYNALLDNDTMLALNKEQTKNLYLKMKERMNRDDVLAIMADRGAKNVMKSARRMMRDGFISKSKRDREVDTAIDELIGAEPRDDHIFGKDDEYSPFWDPQVELQERQNNRYNTRRIFKGERTTVRYYPFMVSVHVMGRFWCGGVIYWKDIVLTSASCLQLAHNNRFFRENPAVLGVRVGSNHSRIGGEMVEALEVYFHPGYNPRTLSCNIALIRLRRQLHFNYHRVPKLIDISHQSEGMPFTAEVLLLGWGVTKTSQKLAYEPIYLQRKFLPVYPNEFCKEVYGDKFITKTMFCAGTFTTGEGACDHDAGGPAILNGKLVGIISFGPTICGYPNAPTVFTLVGAFADWIETVNETMPSYYRGKKRTTTTTPLPLLEFFATETRVRPTETSPALLRSGGTMLPSPPPFPPLPPLPSHPPLPPLLPVKITPGSPNDKLRFQQTGDGDGMDFDFK